MSVRIGDVTTWDTWCGACGQARKVLEEAGEVVDACAVLWGAENYGAGPSEVSAAMDDLLEECADVVQAVCNLLAGLGVEDFTVEMAECAMRNAARGRMTVGKADT